MEIIQNISLLTLISAHGFLGLWFLFSDSRRWSFVMGVCFFLCLLSNFIATVGFSIGPMKFFYFSKNLILIGLSGFVFQLLRSNKIGLILAIIGSISLSIQIYRLKLTQKLVPDNVREIMEKGELLIETTPYHLKDIQQILIPYRGVIDRAFYPKTSGTNLDDFYIIDIPDQISEKKVKLLEELDSAGLIQYGEFNDVIQVDPMNGINPLVLQNHLSVNDPLVKDQWAAEALNFGALYQTLIANKDRIKRKAVVAILDTGVDGEHEDLTMRLFKGPRDNKDPVGHGTHCAGIVGAETNNGKGIASLSFYNDLIQILPIKVLNQFGFGTQAQIIKGMIRAVDEGADVLSMSLGGVSDTPKQKAYSAAVEYALDGNAIVVVSAGNSSQSARQYSPGNVSGVICVTALDEKLELANFSNYLDGIERGIAAPGVNILSTFPGQKYKSLSGTSMAAPFVSSTVGILKAFDPGLSMESAYDILQQSSQYTADIDYSGGLIQPDKALALLLSR